MATSDTKTHSRIVDRTKWLLLATLVVTTAGCRFNVAVLRSLLGDPQVPSAFETRTQVDLTDGDKRLLILCTAAHSVTTEEASLPIDVLTGVATKLRARGVAVVDPDDVANWADDHGAWDDMDGLAEEFDADFIAVIHLGGLSYTEPNSANLYRARASGSIRLMEVVDAGTDEAYVAERYGAAINETYPKSYPISADRLSEGMFHKQALDHLITVFARHFHKYHERETIH